jgi:anaerobic magnesium-protoporphyrin IX monomethyl ester cyclase
VSSSERFIQSSSNLITENSARKSNIRNLLDAGLDTLDYFVQGITSAIANYGETLAPLMHRAGFRYVFLGIENILESDLQFLQASAKNTARADGKNMGNATLLAIEHLHRNKMYVIEGLIVGSPNDTAESIEANLAFAAGMWIGHIFSIRLPIHEP